MDAFKGDGVSRRQAMGLLAGAGAAMAAASPAELLAQAAASPNRLANFPAPKTNGFKTIDGVRIYYEEQGQGIPVVLCPGGRQSCIVTRPLAAKLASKYRVISWDRPNCVGKSDFVFKGSRDVDLWADQIVEILKQINAMPAYFVGPSMGNRTNMAIAVRYPDVVTGLFLYKVSGNNLWPNLPRDYWAAYADIADKGGMKTVAATDYWADLLKDNPANRDRLLKTDPKEFSRVMRRWTDAYKQNDVALMMSEDNLRRHTANGIPTLLVAGCVEDNGHNLETSDKVRKFLPNAEFISPPGECAEFMKLSAMNTAWSKQNNQPAAKWIPYFELSHLPKDVDDFITKTEAARRKKG